MDFSPNKLEQFSKKISSLRDQPNMQPNELKAYFDSSPEEVRQAHNSLCDALTTATTQSTAAANIGFSRTAGVPADTVQAAVENVQSQLTDAVLGNIPSGSVTGDKLAQDVRDHFTTIETRFPLKFKHGRPPTAICKNKSTPTPHKLQRNAKLPAAAIPEMARKTAPSTLGARPRLYW